jgi:hypothetical protein
MIPVTTTFEGTIQTTALPTLVSTATTDAASSQATSPAPREQSDLSAGAGIGIGIAAALGVVLLGLLLGYFLLRRSRRRRALAQKQTPGYHQPDPFLEGSRKPATFEIDGSIRHELH